MGWLRTTGAAVLAVAGFANAQGYYGTVAAENAACPAAQNFQNIGCWANLALSAVEFAVQGTYAASQNPNYNFPGYISSQTSGTAAAVLYNNTVTPYGCATVCRGHGYQYTYLINGLCYCTMNDPASVTGATNTGTCGVTCPGDSGSICGGATVAAGVTVLYDPSYKSYSSFSTAVGTTANLNALAASSKFLGCFRTPNFPNVPGQSVTGAAGAIDQTAGSMGACLAVCAKRGYPLAYATAATSGVLCECGTEFGYQSYKVNYVAGSTTCSVACDGSGNACDPTQANCCGTSTVVPVYINPELTGCFTPTIPGVPLTDPTSGSITGYQCAAVPASLTGGPKTLATTSTAATIATAVPTHPVQVVSGANVYYQLGCAATAQAITAVGSTATFTTATSDISSCAAYCADANAAVFQVSTASYTSSSSASFTCTCGNDVPTTFNANLIDMAGCAIRCPNGATLCGGATNVLVYGKQSRFATGSMSVLLSSASATTLPTYGCTSVSTSSTVTSSTITSSSTGTSSGTSSTVSSGTSSTVTVSSSTGSSSAQTGSSSTTSSFPTLIPTSNGTIPTVTLSSSSSSGTTISSETTPSGTGTEIPSFTESDVTGSQPTETDVTSGTEVPPETTAEPTGTGSPTTTSPSGTTSIAVAYPTVTSFSAIFDLPAGEAILTALKVCNDDGTNCQLIVYVVQNMGCFVTPTGESPFTPNFGIPDQNLNAEECTEECAARDYGLASDVSGDCYCGDTQNPLTQAPDSSCRSACPGDPTQYCGGGSTSLKRRTIKRQSGQFAQIFGITRAADAGYPGLTTITLSSSTALPTNGTALPTESDVPTASFLPTTEPTGSDVLPTGTVPPTSSGPITAPSSSSTPIAVVLGILPPNTATLGLKKRQAGSFIGGAGPLAPTDCTEATTFVLANGQLSSGGQLVSTDPGVPYIPLAVSATIGSITTEFVSINGELFWNNAAFLDGSAGFCQDASGRVYATFEGAAAEPAGCLPVTVVAYPAYQCVGGVINPSATPPSTTAPTGVLGNGTLSLAYPYYFPEASPVGQECVTVVEEWVVGETSLLPEPTA